MGTATLRVCRRGAVADAEAAAAAAAGRSWASEALARRVGVTAWGLAEVEPAPVAATPRGTGGSAVARGEGLSLAAQEGVGLGGDPSPPLGVSGAAALCDDDLVLVVEFALPQRAVAPGQVLVLYAADDGGAAGGDGADALGAAAAWDGSGRECLGCAPILAGGATRWERGLCAPGEWVE